MVFGADRIVGMIRSGVEVEDAVTGQITTRPLMTP